MLPPSLSALASLCATPGIPPAEDRLAGPTTTIEHPGLLLDSSALEARLPGDRRDAIEGSLLRWADRRHCPKRELPSSIGGLSFAAEVVPAGRTFLRRTIDLSTSAPRLPDTIHLDEGFHLDIQWWQAFTSPWTGRSLFLLPGWTPAPDLHLFTDSAGSIGMYMYVTLRVCELSCAEVTVCFAHAGD